MVITGGADAFSDIAMFVCFSKTPALSRTGDCRPFSADSDGTVLGEGVVLFALKRLGDAEAGGDRIYAVLRGIGSSSDGRSTAVYTPLPAGQARALRRAYEVAGYGPDTVELVEAHGTGTRAGDSAECAALREVFTATGRSDVPWCALGSVKSQVGHTKSTAGAAGLLKAVLALHHKVLPPTIKVSRPNPALGLEGSPLYLNTTTRPWIRGADHPRRASVSSFGFGGSNFHVTLEEYAHGPGTTAGRLRAAPSELLPLSASSPGELRSLIDGLLSRCRRAADGPETEFIRCVRDRQQAFDAADEVRLTVVATGLTDLAGRLEQAGRLLRSRPDDPFDLPGGTHYRSGPPLGGDTAFLFPGQGSQYVGMGADLAVHLSAARAVWDQAADVDLGDDPLHRVVFSPPAFTDEDRAAQRDRLTATEWAQPALAAHSAALLAVLRDLGLEAGHLAGHSLGELAALHAAGGFDLPALLRLTRRRGVLMSRVTQPGGMLGVQASWAQVTAAIDEEKVPGLWAVNHNAPEQTVVAGRSDALEAFERTLSGRGIRARRLAVSAAFHSPLVAEAADPLRAFLDELEVAAPVTPVYGAADGEPYPADPDAVRDRVAAQLAAPVRFADQVEAMYARGVRTFVEVGPGTVLTGLVSANLGGRDHLAVALDRPGGHGVTVLHEGLAALAAHGVPLRFAALWEGYAPPPEPPPSPSAATVLISGTNYGKPYPPPGGAAMLPPPNPEPPVPEDTTENTPERHDVTTEHPANGQAASPTAAQPDGAWIQAIQEIQRQTAEVQAAYQQAMTHPQLAFLATAEACLTGLSNGSVPHRLEMPAPPNGSVPPALPALPALPAMGPVPATPTDEVPAPTAPAHQRMAPAPPAPQPQPAPPPEPAPTAPPPAEPPRPAADLAAVVVDVVAEKTGYPVEILTPRMHLEGDLGIDSIKRMEILSAVRGRVPDLPDVDAAELARLQTLGEVIDSLDANGPAAGAPSGIGAGSSSAAVKPDPPPEAVVRRFRVRETAIPASGLAMAGLDAAPLVITGDEGEIAQRLVARLGEDGITATIAATAPPDARGLIFLGGLRPGASPDDAAATAREAFRAARAVAPRLAGDGGLFVTVQDTGGDFGLSGRQGDRAWSGGLVALARTAAREWPRASVKAIDIECGGRDADEIAAAIAGELRTGGLTFEAGLHADGTRTTLVTAEDQDTPAGPPPLPPDAVVVVSGGGRGVTAEAITALARATRPRLVLIGRTRLDDEPAWATGVVDEAGLRRAFVAEHRREGRPLPAPAAVAATARRILAVREVRARLDTLAAAGIRVRYEAADITDATAVTAVLDAVRADWGPIAGIVHGSGVLADTPIADKTDEAFSAVYDTKVKGLRALLTATDDDPVRMLCLFSSVAGQYGNVGQCDYAMANEVLCQVAAARKARDPALSVHAVCWGPWHGGMVGPEIAARLTGQGIDLIPPGSGAAAFVADLACDHRGHRVVITAGGDPSALARRVPARRRARLDIAARTHPHLRDHSVHGARIVPMAVAVDWLARAAADLCPGGMPLTLRDVGVCRRLALPGFDDHATGLLVTAEQDGGQDGTVALALTGDDGVRYYRALLRSGDRASPRDWTPPERLPIPDDPQDNDVRGVRHGPMFRSLGALTGLGPAGADAGASGLKTLGWRDDGHVTDPAALDAVLKLACLWGGTVLGRATLPMGVSTVRLHRRGPLSGRGRAVVRATAVYSAHAECDAALLDEDGTPRAELFGVSVVRQPG
jgi:acyl transferase domain-containing protein/acyl carrier protein